MKNTQNIKLSLALCASLSLSISAFADDKADIVALQEELKELKEMTQILIDETSDLKSGFNYTIVDTSKSFSGLGAAASKVYYSSSPLSIGGYGEMFYAHTTKADGSKSSIVDVYRFVPYIGYKFSDNIILNTEIEFEHGGVANDGGTAVGGEVIVEFMYLDFLINKNLNLRAGNMLMPMGLINERHEPTLFTTVQRPSTSKYLIPSTWHESGVMAFGDIVDGVEYKLAALTALDPSDSGSKWLRDGRNGAFKNTNPKLSITARVDYTGYNGLMAGVSIYRDSELLMADIHVDYKMSGFRAYGVYTQTTRSNATDLQVQKANGGFLNTSFDVLSLTSFSETLPLFVQYESINPQAQVLNATDGESTNTVTFGLNYFPHPQVVLKADYALATTQSNTDKVASVSMGFVF